MENTIYSKLYDWQKKIVDRIKDKPSYGLFLEMGLGKTPLSLALCEANNCDRLIIITINAKAMEKENVKGSFPWWIKQSSKFSDFQILYKTSKISDISPSKGQVLIRNYEGLFKRGDKLKEKAELRDTVMRFIECSKGKKVGLLVDESHKLKSFTSLQTKSVIKLQSMLSLKSLVYTYLLTGTPFTTGYIDLWTQLKVLGCPRTKTAFIDTFCIRGNIRGLLNYQQPIIGYRNLNLLFKMVHRYAITIKSEEVVNLPESVFVEHSYPRTDDFKMFSMEKVRGSNLIAYRKKRGSEADVNPKAKINNPYFRNIAYPEEKWIADTCGTLWRRARQLSIGFQGNSDDSKWFDRTRLEMLKKFLADNPDNYIVFYSFTSELLELYDMANELGYNADCYCGEIKSLENYNAFCSLPEEKKLTSNKNIIIANWQSGSTGVNWQEYNKCIIFDYPVYRDYAQGLARIRRLGQKSKTTIYHVFTQENWLDESRKNALDARKDYNDKTFESDLERVQDILEKGE